MSRYVDILEQTFLIRKLPPFFANLRKRLVKISLAEAPAADRPAEPALSIVRARTDAMSLDY